MTPVSTASPLWLAWQAYKQSEDYANTVRWAAHPEHVEGALWAAFERGFSAQSPTVLPTPAEVAAGVEDAERALQSRPDLPPEAGVLVYRSTLRTLLTVRGEARADSDAAFQLTIAASALENWGTHHNWCELMYDPATGEQLAECNCGYLAAIQQIHDAARSFSSGTETPNA